MTDSPKASSDIGSSCISPHETVAITEPVVLEFEKSTSPSSLNRSRGSRKCHYRHHHCVCHSRNEAHHWKQPSRPSLISNKDDEESECVDGIPKNMSFSVLDGIAILFSIGSFLFDIITDVAVSVIHYQNQKYVYFALTICFIIIPTLVTTGVSLRWYVLDAREEGSPPISKLQWTFRILFLLLQLGPILRYFDSLIYGLKFRLQKKQSDQEKYFQYMIYEDTDAAMLRLFECFMEAAPQLILQIYILAKSPNFEKDDLMVVIQIISIFASLVSLSWSLVSYQRALRMSLPDKANMSWKVTIFYLSLGFITRFLHHSSQGTAVQFLWRFFVIAARVLSLALFASVFDYWISVVCSVHWVLMFTWIVSMKTTFCDNRVEETGYNAVIAVMFIFCYFNPIDNPTRYRFAAFYSFTFLESSLLMALWYTNVTPTLWYRLPAMIGYFLSFLIGMTFMIVYYLLLHPTGEIKICRNSDDIRGEEARQEYARRGGYKRQIQNGLWTTQGRMLHPRPTVPEALPSSSSDLEISHKRENKRKSHSLEEKINCAISNGTTV